MFHSLICKFLNSTKIVTKRNLLSEETYVKRTIGIYQLKINAYKKQKSLQLPSYQSRTKLITRENVIRHIDNTKRKENF